MESYFGMYFKYHVTIGSSIANNKFCSYIKTKLTQQRESEAEILV